MSGRVLVRTSMVWGVVAVLAAGCLPPTLEQRQLVAFAAPSPAIVFENVRLFRGTSPAAEADQTVVVEGDRIVFAGPAANAPETPDALLVDGRGKTLLPGLIDAHTHLTSSGSVPWAGLSANPQHNLEAWTYAGVTTIYDLGGPPGDVKDAIQEAARRGRPVPRVFFTGLMATAEGGHPIPLAKAMAPFPLSAVIGFIVPQLKGPDDAEGFVSSTLAEGVDAIKVIYDRIPSTAPLLRKDTLRAVIQAAHQRRKKVFVHVGSSENAVEACEAGADVLAHGPYRSPVSVEDARRIAAGGCPVIYTVAAWYGVKALSDGTYQPTPLAREISPPSLLEPVTAEAPLTAERNEVFDDLTRMAAKNAAYWDNNILTLHEAGVTILVGTDSPLPGAYPGSSIHEEMERLVNAGIPAGEVLWSATGRSSTLIQDAPEFGTIEARRLADLVLVEGDPTVDITRSSAIVMVVRGGQVVERMRPAAGGS